MTPEEIGLSGRWQVIASNAIQNQHQLKESASLEIGCYSTSLPVKEHDDFMGSHGIIGRIQKTSPLSHPSVICCIAL